MIYALQIFLWVTSVLYLPVYQVEVWGETAALKVAKQPGKVLLKEHLECSKVFHHLMGGINKNELLNTPIKRHMYSQQ